jgi:hypothetical protein
VILTNKISGTTKATLGRIGWLCFCKLAKSYLGASASMMCFLDASYAGTAVGFQTAGRDASRTEE